MNADRLRKLRERAERARRASLRNAGRLDSLLDRLKTEFGCKSLDEAEQELQELDARDSWLDGEADRWGDLVEGQLDAGAGGDFGDGGE